MCVVTVVNRVEKTKKKYFVPGSKATVSAAIQQIVGSFEDIWIDDMISKDLSSFLGLLDAMKRQKTSNSNAPIAHKPKIYPDFALFKG